MKKLLSLLLAALMMVCAGSALAGAGDAMILLLNENDDYTNGSIQNLIRVDEKIYLFISGMSQKLKVYDMETGALDEYDMQELEDRMNGLTGEEDPAGEQGTEQEEEAPGISSESILCWFAWKDDIFALVNNMTFEGEGSTLDGGHVRRLILADGKADLEKEDALRLDWTGMTETAGSWQNSRYVGSSGVIGDHLLVITSDDSGNQMLADFDLNSGEMTEQMMPEVNELTVTREGKVLISRYRWDETSEMIIGEYDPESGETEELVRFNLLDGNPSSVVFDAEKDILYFARNGEIFAAPGADLTQAAAVNDCPLNGRTFAELTGDGRILVWDHNAVFLRNTDPSVRSEVTLRIRPYAWGRGLESAVYDFASRRSDIAVVREDYGDESTLLQAMMNRDGRVDVYLMSLDSSVFSALFDRGFLTDLSGSAKLTGELDRMYPFVKDALSKDGKLLAIPLSCSGEGLGYNAEVLEKLGLSEEDLPKTWEALPDFLQEIAGRFQGSEFRPFEFYSARSDFLINIVNQVLTQYSMVREDAPLNAEITRKILDRIQKMDFDALGMMTEEEIEQLEQENRYEEMGANKEALLSVYAEYAISSWSTYTPLRMAVEEGEEPVLPVSMTVAFINPYSEHPEEAMAFLECLIDHLDNETKYALDPGMNEPVRFQNHEEEKKTLQKWLDSARLSLEKAEDEEDREKWEGIVSDYEKALEDFDRTNWAISPEAIRSYRERAAWLRPLKWDFYRMLSSAEGGDQYWDLLNGFARGEKSTAELLSFIDKKVQMMRMEGN